MSMLRGTGEDTFQDVIETDKPDGEKSTEELRAERDEWRYLFNQLIYDFPEPIFAVDADKNSDILIQRQRGHTTVRVTRQLELLAISSSKRRESQKSWLRQ